MHGLILAAGRGSRMGPLTQERPKCLVELRGKPLLHYQLEALQKAHISPLYLVGGYRCNQLEGGPYTLLKNPHWEHTNMVASLLSAAPHLARHTTLIAYADLLYSPAHLATLAACPGDIALSYDLNWHSLWSRRFANPLTDAETFELHPNGTLASIGQKPQTLQEIQGQYMGLLKLTPTGWSYILKAVQTLDPTHLAMTDLLTHLLSLGHTIHTTPIKGNWYEIDSPSDLTLYESELSHSYNNFPLFN